MSSVGRSFIFQKPFLGARERVVLTATVPFYSILDIDRLGHFFRQPYSRTKLYFL